MGRIPGAPPAVRMWTDDEEDSLRRGIEVVFEKEIATWSATYRSYRDRTEELSRGPHAMRRLTPAYWEDCERKCVDAMRRQLARQLQVLKEYDAPESERGNRISTPPPEEPVAGPSTVKREPDSEPIAPPPADVSPPDSSESSSESASESSFDTESESKPAPRCSARRKRKRTGIERDENRIPCESDRKREALFNRVVGLARGLSDSERTHQLIDKWVDEYEAAGSG